MVFRIPGEVIWNKMHIPFSKKMLRVFAIFQPDKEGHNKKEQNFCPSLTFLDKEMKDMQSPEFAVPENSLRSLLTAANSSTLVEALDFLVEASKTDRGRSDLASKNIVPTVLQLSRCLCNSSTPHLLFSSLKLLRNLCAGEIANQNSFIEENGVEVVSIAWNSVGFVSDSDYSIVQIGIQVLGNVSLAGERHRSAVWGRFFPVGFMDIARIRMFEISDPLCMVLHTCLDESHERVLELCGVRGLPLLAEIITTASTAGFREDWFKLLLSRICFEESCFASLVSELSSAENPSSDDIKCRDVSFTTKQAFLLSILSEILNQRICEITVSNDIALCVLGVLKRAIGVVDFVSRGKSGLPTHSAAIDVLGYSLNILRDICAQDDLGNSTKECATDVVDSLLFSGLLELLLDLLHDLEPPAIIRKSIKQDDSREGATSSELSKVCPYKGFRRDIVAVIGNCLYHRKDVQDEIRQKNGILLLLQQCVVDVDNPFLREWGIWSVRNLLEENAENQREVAELKLQGTVDVPEISGLGLRVEVDEKTRRAKLVNVS